MSDDLTLQIKVAAREALAELRASEQAANKAEKAFMSFAETFKRIGEYEKKMADETAKAREKVDSLAQAFKKMGDAMRIEALAATGKAFAGLAEQIKREADMLDRLHSPMRQAIQDHQTLEMLMKRGSITAQQYSQEMTRLHNANTPIAAGSTQGSMMSGVSGTVAGLVGVGAAKSVLDLSDTYTSLENRLRQVSKSQGDLNHLMEATKGIADRTRSDWSATAESFVRLTNATKQLGLSQERALRLQETLNMALQSSGASSSEATAGTLQLMQALSSGALQGDEFRSISESLPGLMDIFAKQLGVTRGELKKMGAEGKITTDIVVKGLEAASGSIRDQFAASTSTAAQQWTVFKNQLTESAGQFVKNTNVIGTLGSILSSLGSIIGPVSSAIGGLVNMVSGLGDVIGVKLQIGIGTLVGTLVGGPLGAAVGTLAEGFIRSSSNMQEWTKNAELWAGGMDDWSARATRAFSGVGAEMEAFNAGIKAANPAVASFDESIAALVDRLDRLPATLDNVNKKMGTTTALAGALAAFIKANKLIKEATDALEDQGKQLKDIRGPQIGYHKEVDALNRLLETGQITQVEFDNQLAKIEKHYDKLANGAKKYAESVHLAWEAEQQFSGNYGAGNQPKWRNIFSGDSEFAPGAAGSSTELGARAGETSDRYKNPVRFGDAGVWGADSIERADAAMDKYNKELEKTQKRYEDISAALQPMEDGFNRLFTTGKFGFRQMINEWWQMLTSMATHKLFTTLASGLANAGQSDAPVDSAGLAGLGGGLAGAVAGGNHAFGGSVIVPGSGGQDSVVMVSRVTPGERVDYTPPGQSSSNGGGGAPTAPMKAVIEYQGDARALRRGDPDAVRFVLEVARDNPDAFGRR